MVTVSLNTSGPGPFFSSTSIRNTQVTAISPSIWRNYRGFSLKQSQRCNLQVVHMASDNDKTTRRSSLDSPTDGAKGKEQKWNEEGSITESLPNGMFRILLDNGGMVLGYISGKIRQSFIRILPGDRVRVEVNRYDSSRVRIVYRLRDKGPGSKD